MQASDEPFEDGPTFRAELLCGDWLLAGGIHLLRPSFGSQWTTAPISIGVGLRPGFPGLNGARSNPHENNPEIDDS